MNYNMNKLDLTPIKLMHELVSVEQSLVKPDNVYFPEGFSKPKGKPKGKNKNHTKKKKGKVPVFKTTTM